MCHVYMQGCGEPPCKAAGNSPVKLTLNPISERHLRARV